MRTEQEWQSREKELLEHNNKLLKRARKAEKALLAIHNKEPQLYWYADDPESGCSSIDDVLEYVDDEFGVVEIVTGYHGPTLFAARVRVPHSDEGKIVQADTLKACQKLVDEARADYVKSNGEEEVAE